MTTPAIASAVTAQSLPLRSRTYDDGTNPLLRLEERHLAPLFPDAPDLDVADLGCGTGRWLEYFAQKSGGKLFGVDRSPEMLGVAHGKLGGRARLVQADCSRPALDAACADLVVSSFVIGYLADPGWFAETVARTARPSADVFLSDMHPETAVRLRWKRSYQCGDRRVELPWHPWSLFEVVAAFRRHGFEPVCILEPRFGEPERPIFAAAGRPDLFQQTAGDPAIYILQLRRATPAAAARTSFRFAGIALGPTEAAAGSLAVQDARVQSLLPPRFAGRDITADFRDCLAFPGLLNGHDHLEFGLFPRLGGRVYRNAQQWAEDIHRQQHAVIAAHRAVPVATRIWWGALRNLLCGATTVCHHNPLHAAMLRKDFPIRVVRDFAWAHSLAFDPDVARKSAAAAAGQPFVIHLGEGVDQASRRELLRLRLAGALGPSTVVVHGLAFKGEDIDLLNDSGAALVWCPISNDFLFRKHIPVADLARVARVALGTDSPLTSHGDLLDELRFARHTVGVPAADLYRQVSTGAAQVLRAPGAGTLRPGVAGDLVAVKYNAGDPCDRLCALSYRDIELVLVGGSVYLASDEARRRLPAALCDNLRPLLIDGLLRWVRAPLGRLFASASAHLGCELRLNGRRLQHVSTAWL